MQLAMACVQGLQAKLLTPELSSTDTKAGDIFKKQNSLLESNLFLHRLVLGRGNEERENCLGSSGLYEFDLGLGIRKT